MSEEQEEDVTEATASDEERALTQAERAKARTARDVLSGPTGDALRAAQRDRGLAENIDALTALSGTNTARLVEGIMPSLNAAAMFPAFDTARLVEGVMPSLNAAAMFPAFDTGALIRGALPASTDEFFDRIRRGFERLVPRNLRSLEYLRYEDMTTVMREEGIPFVLVPDAATAAALLDADDAGARRLVLVDRAEPVFEACERILALCVDPRIAFPGSQVRQAIGAYRAGYPGPAQASAATVLDSVLYDHPEKTHRRYLVGSLTAKGGVTRTAYTMTLDHVRLMTLTPISAVQIEDSRGKNEPRIEFSRHSTVHRVTEEQYTESNAVQAIMLATSVLGFIQDLW